GRFAGCSPDVVGEVFQFGISPPVQPLIAQRFVVAGAIGDPQLAVFPELELAAEAGWLFNHRAKDVRRDRAHAWQALKLAHLPKGSTDSLYFLSRLLPLFQRVIQLAVKPSHHSAFFLGWKLGQVLFAPLEGEDSDPMQSQHAPLPIARLDQRFEFALRVAPVEQLINQRTVNLAGASVPIHTSLSLPSRRSKHIPSTSASSLLVGLELISRLCRGSQMINRSTSGRTIPLAQRVNAPASMVRKSGAWLAAVERPGREVSLPRWQNASTHPFCLHDPCCPARCGGCADPTLRKLDSSSSSGLICSSSL